MHPSLWVREAPTLDTPSTPPETAEVVIIGGGIAGVSTALALARSGVQAVLLEAGEIGGRASGRNDGQLLLGLGEHYNRIVGQFGAARARLLWDFIRENNTRLKADLVGLGVDCDFTAAGGLRLAETEHEWQELESAAKLLTEEGFEHELCDRGALAELLPAAVGFHGALRLAGEACVQPAAMVRGLAQAASDAGARLYQGTAVTAVRPGGNGFELELAAGTNLLTTVVVHCTSTLARDLDSSGFLAEQLFPFRGQIIATDPLPATTLAQFAPYAMSSNFCYEYFRIHGGRFVIGGERWSVPGEEQGTLDDTATNASITANLIAYSSRHFPVLRQLEFPQVWTGIMAGTSDGLPLLGALPGLPGCFALTGFNGYGLSFAYYAGCMLAEQILEGRASHPATAEFAPRRFA